MRERIRQRRRGENQFFKVINRSDRNLENEIVDLNLTLKRYSKVINFCLFIMIILINRV